MYSGSLKTRAVRHLTPCVGFCAAYALKDSPAVPITSAEPEPAAGNPGGNSVTTASLISPRSIVQPWGIVCFNRCRPCATAATWVSYQELNKKIGIYGILTFAGPVADSDTP
jgi:hypothetical protein